MKIKSTLFPCSVWSMRFKLLFLSLVLAGLILAGCNLRENSLLPPNLDPKEYIIENTIRVYSDHLIKSENDRSYLYIPKESIADSALWYGDIVTLKKVQSFTERDSLALGTDVIELTKTYQISVIRNNTEILLDSIPNFATLYTDLGFSGKPGVASLVQSSWILSASPTEVYPYGSGRCFFDLDGNGEHSLVNFNNSKQIRIEAGSKNVQALIVTESDYIRIWFPAAYMSSALELGLKDNLENEEILRVQRLFPGFAMGSKVLDLQTDYSGTAVPIVHYRMPQRRNWGTQWTRLNGSSVSAWPSGDDTWLLEDDELVSFLKGSGSYFLATPLAIQDELSLPLNGSYSQLYLQDIWLDLNDINLANTELKLDLAPEINTTINDYFQGSPFTLAQGYSAFSLNFEQNGSVIESLPDDNWIEYGFRSSSSANSSSKLFRVFRTDTTDHLNYKNYGTAYDSTHFSYDNGFVYAGYNSSGFYIYGQASESSSTLNVPCLKANLQLQTVKTYLSWSDSSLPCNLLTIDYKAPLQTSHPWLSGYPYQVTSASSILKLSATYRNRYTDEIPSGLFISTDGSATLSDVINFSSEPSHPKLYHYKAASTFGHNSFVLKSGKLQISPAAAGYLIDGRNLSRSKTLYSLAMFNSMIYDDYDLEVYLSSAQVMPPANFLQITPKTTITDEYGVFASQYSLSSLAPIYDFKILGSPDLYATWQPLIRIKQPARTNNKLFSISSGDFYRIYSYRESDTLDGWHFRIADGHVSFYLAYDAEYAVVNDLSVHQSVDTIVNQSTRDHISSLYQAQLVIPQQFLGSTLPLGNHVTLSVASSPPPGVNALSTYQLLFRNSTLQVITPNFYNVIGATALPYIYVPIPDYSSGENIRLFYRNLNGIVTEFTRVPGFSEAPTGEFIMVGNCAVCFVDNSGLFYTTN